ncbi:hypothetical protein SPRG_00306 [Saprolegnia parasitica CBS 223.65]|uniref:Uncharacterized protein n=1 Tax=Saprolegnia parasitica (strain CBS 223.65) TaxID=695850 RepID=A0A067CXL7_SAPPC|nr:hypothetical protein SPRG_00306 [Saprolegnia parasitica CBS 223.65]KDO35459.1 hypothetical protein SPRG_00306 [Saprolegnia parasitica CBS 223.65]|eukprot:XP_012193798.1 hypothetical protein SPRG_00306 [Saprolegnia parasitica CBS 223.65]
MGRQRKTQRAPMPLRRLPTGKEPYEEAIQILRNTATFVPQPWHTFELPHYVEPLLRVSTMDEWLGWPLGKAQALEVMDAYTTSPGVAVVPAAHLAVQSADWHHALDVARQYIRTMFSPSGSFSLQLSHLLLDATGVSPTPSLRPAGSIGTVAFLLPSLFTGGAMTLTNDGATHVWQPNDTFLTRLHCLVQAASSDITVDRITSGRRALLVYDLVDTSPSTTFADAVAKLAAAAHEHPRLFNFVSLRLAHPNPSLDYDQLTTGDKIVVQALAQSGAYDVVLAEHEKYADFFNDGESDCAATIKRFQEVPGAALPDVIADHTHYLSAEALLFEKADPRTDNYNGPRYSIFFWPKSARILFVDLETGVNALQEAVGGHSTDDLLGQPSIQALLDALLLRFNDRSEPEVGMAYGQSLGVLCDVLIALQERDTVQHLLRDIVRYTKDAESFSGVASAISSLVAFFGWETLSVSLHAMLRRWSQSARGLHLCYRLVANLAGAAESPICAPISQPFAVELIVSLWSQIAAEVESVIQPGGTVIVEDGCMDDSCAAAAPRAIFQFTLFLQLHVARPERVRQRWLYNRLPDRVVAQIASFLGPAVSLAEMEDMEIFEPVLDMTPGVAAAMRIGLNHGANMGFINSILDAYLEGADADMEDNVHFDLQLVSSLLVVAAAGNRFTAVLERLTFDRHLALAPSMLAFVQLWPEIASPSIRQQCSELLLDAAGDSIVANQGRIGRCRPTPVLNAVSALTYFAKFDRVNLMTFMATWLAALGRDAVQTTLGDVVIELHTRVPSEARLISRLARVYLADVANDATVPRLTDYALRNVAVPACCDHCSDFRSYIEDPVRVTFAVGCWNSCDRLLEVVRRHPLQLQLQHTTSPRHDENFELEYDIEFGEVVDEEFVCKVRQPGQVTASELREHFARQRAATERAEKTQRITAIRDAVMASMMAHDASEDHRW